MVTWSVPVFGTLFSVGFKKKREASEDQVNESARLRSERGWSATMCWRLVTLFVFIKCRS